ncbi:MAG: hypothetical protein IIA02_07010 [Proteobacteria bacterium]|uniref:hypothetical protein n=1 Tax=Aquabacterium sp. TaxID=1872578 RepID=UPI0035C6DAAC|nr:hypothetical protein [Pseudomonadota bacterium]
MHTAAACGLAAWLAAGTAWAQTAAQTAAQTPSRGPVVHGMDWSLSGFATVGHVASDRDWRWRRFVDEGGTLWRDTIVGGQLDARLSPNWSATLQLTLAPSTRHERQWSVEAAWAFLSWRPDNDWLLRLGKQRVPIFLNAENRDVGQTYAFARLPSEVYALSPTTDVAGLSVSRTWPHGDGDLGADVYAGRAHIAERSHSRDLGARFVNVDTDIVGVALTLRRDDLTWRIGLHHAVSRRQDGQPLPSRYPFVSPFPGFGYYQVSDALGGPGVLTTERIANTILNLGVDARLAPQWRVVAEFARNIQHRTDLGANTVGAYVAVLHTLGHVTPYLSLARLQTVGAPREAWQALNAAGGSGSDALSVAQRVAADSIPFYDQTSLGLGAAWALSPRSQLKGEWKHTRIGKRSAMADDPPQGTVSDTGVNVLSLNYSVAF